MEKLPFMASSPPPYETASYPRLPRVVKRRLSARTALGAVLTTAVIWLCFVVNGEIKARNNSVAGLASAPERFADAQAQCQSILTEIPRIAAAERTQNPRWSSISGHKNEVVLRNATLFDGERFLDGPVDIRFSKGLVVSVSSTDAKATYAQGTVVHDVQGRYVTPGIVDMHAHQFSTAWPMTATSGDENEISPEIGTTSSMMRVLDALKPYDEGARVVASGGITTSLILPGSANLIGGEAMPVKNALNAGDYGEPLVADLLLEKNIPKDERRRYMKMAMGENPKNVWGHTRMGNAWLLRARFQQAKEIRQKQDRFCADLAAVSHSSVSAQAKFLDKSGQFPSELELESLVALLRGKVLLQNHNYEPEDFEMMIRISEEFGYKVGAFHHAIEGWQVPHMLLEKVPNITMAIFAEFSLYKQESYSPSLYAGHILDKHGISVAYKSDHVMSFTNAKYLVAQAAVASSFHLPALKALQAVTSVPARSMEQDHRIGYCRPGYDADIVVWDAHPLTVGATPLQVFIDGSAQFEDKTVKDSMGQIFTSPSSSSPKSIIQPQTRMEPDDDAKRSTCQRIADANNIIFTGISNAFLQNYPELASKLSEKESGPFEMVVGQGQITCFGSPAACSSDRSALEVEGKHTIVNLKNGHVTPGLTAVTKGLGIREIADELLSGDGDASGQSLDDPESILHAKYGLFLDGKVFARARLGGVTRAISAPLSNDYISGVSTEILTSGKKTLVNGGIVQGDVAFHLSLDTTVQADEKSVSRGVQKIRKMLKNGSGKHNETIFGQLARGDMPLVVHSSSQYDIEQLIMIKQDFPDTHIVLLGGREAGLVAQELADAKIPVILTENRSTPEEFRSRHALVGPPMSRTVASYFVEAGVEFAFAIVDGKLYQITPLPELC